MVVCVLWVKLGLVAAKCFMWQVAISRQQVRIVAQRANIWKPPRQIIRPKLHGAQTSLVPLM
jgi:hypothetical protein